VARALARAVVEQAPDRALDVARELLAHAHDAYRLEGLAALDAAPRVPLHAVCELLHDRSGAVRLRAAEVLGHRGDESAAEPLRGALEDGASGPPLDEADALGRALAQVAPLVAERLFDGWIAPRSRFLRGPTARERALQWAAVAGYGALPGPAAEAALRAVGERAEGDLRRHLLATLARRRKAFHAHG
jgi:HEAT repeat protein